MSPRLKCMRFFGGFVCGVAVSTGGCVAAVKLYLRPEESIQEKGNKLTATGAGVAVINCIHSC